MSSTAQIFLANTKMLYRDKSGFFWNILLPAGIYTAVSILPVGRLFSTDVPYSTYVLPGIIAMAILQGGIYTLAYYMVEMRARGVIRRFLATPIKKSELVVGLLASRLVIMILQVLLLTVIGVVFFGARLEASPLYVLLLTVIGGSIFLLIGLLMSTWASSYQSMAPITSAVGLPLTLLGNIFYPIDLLPEALQTVAKFLPITYLAEGLRGAFLYEASWQTLGKDIVILFVWFLIMLTLTIRVFKLKE